MGRVDAPDVWLQPGTMVVLGLGQRSYALARMVLARAQRLALHLMALGGSASSADGWPSDVSARR